MKTSHLIPYLMTIAVVTGCIKEDGEPYTIERSLDKERTIVTSYKGYMYGTALKDSIVVNTFQTLMKANGLEDLDVYISMESVYDTIEVQRNAVKECGYVYSPTNPYPTVGGDSCHIFDKKNIKWSGDTTSTSLQFSGEQHGLKFNNNYFIRSYVVTTHGDTCYNPVVCQEKTVIPSNVWFKRKDANLDGRCDAITATTDGGRVFMYGGRGTSKCFDDMWVYDATNDTWEQKASFPEETKPYTGPTKRCNGAAFMLYFGLTNDTLMYVLGGEDYGGDATKYNFFYSLKNNRYDNSSDHPQDRAYIEPFDHPRTGMTAFNIKVNGEVMHMVGMGKVKVLDGEPAVEPQIFYYDQAFDVIKVNSEGEDDSSHVHTWRVAGSLSKDGSEALDKTAIGFYQAVVVNIDETRVIIGSGEGSDGKMGRTFYELGMSNTYELQIKKLLLPPADFVARKNAAAFYLKYVKDGTEYDRFYVGTGTDENGYPLKDFWALDFISGDWERIADCGNVYRTGAIGFKVLRVDDYFVKEFAEPQERGIVAFGRGETNNENQSEACHIRKDVWEYLP